MTSQSQETKPNINVTPLIDVLLVLLIIFMVAAPRKPSRFLAKAPPPPDDSRMIPHDHTLVVTIQPDRTLMLNSLTDMGTTDDTSKLATTLVRLFEERRKNRAFRYELIARPDLPEESRVEKTVFIKAPRGIIYNDVVKVIDGIKGAGASPIGLQLDGPL